MITQYLSQKVDGFGEVLCFWWGHGYRFMLEDMAIS